MDAEFKEQMTTVCNGGRRAVKHFDWIGKRIYDTRYTNTIVT